MFPLFALVNELVNRQSRSEAERRNSVNKKEECKKKKLGKKRNPGHLGPRIGENPFPSCLTGRRWPDTARCFRFINRKVGVIDNAAPQICIEMRKRMAVDPQQSARRRFRPA